MANLLQYDELGEIGEKTYEGTEKNII